MKQNQRDFLLRIAALIPRLFAEMQHGNASSEFTLGVRQLDNRRIRLLIRVEVIDPGVNPMRTHGLQRGAAGSAETVAAAGSQPGAGAEAHTTQPLGPHSEQNRTPAPVKRSRTRRR